MVRNKSHFIVLLLGNPSERALRALESPETLIFESDLIFPILLLLESLLGFSHSMTWDHSPNFQTVPSFNWLHSFLSPGYLKQGSSWPLVSVVFIEQPTLSHFFMSDHVDGQGPCWLPPVDCFYMSQSMNSALRLALIMSFLPGLSSVLASSSSLCSQSLIMILPFWHSPQGLSQTWMKLHFPIILVITATKLFLSSWLRRKNILLFFFSLNIF